MKQNTAEISRQERVINAAWEVFARFGYKKASMQDIAEAADVSKSVLFKYYQTKENLYRTVFRLAADEIAQADAEAKTGRIAGETVFSAMRRTVNARMQLFARAPYVYAFSYTAAYDADPLARELVEEAFARAGVGNGDDSAYLGLRSDLSSKQAKQMIFWISQGFLGDQLARGMAEPQTLRQEYTTWIDLMERMMTDKGENKQ
jgi:TetR/AcrR family transcriptional regulator